MAFMGRFKELMKKYGKVALGVHFSVSAASISGLYVAVRNNVDVESVFEKVGITGVSSKPQEEEAEPQTSIPRSETSDDGFVTEIFEEKKEKKRNRTAELAASSGGALALAVLCNKALFPVRVPITIALTPPIARFLARRKLIKNTHGRGMGNCWYVMPKVEFEALGMASRSIPSLIAMVGRLLFPLVVDVHLYWIKNEFPRMPLG